MRRAGEREKSTPDNAEHGHSIRPEINSLARGFGGRGLNMDLIVTPAEERNGR